MGCPRRSVPSGRIARARVLDSIRRKRSWRHRSAFVLALSDSLAAIAAFRSCQEKNDLQYRQAEQHREKTDELIRRVDSQLVEFREQQRIMNDRLQRELKDREQYFQRQLREKDRTIAKLTDQCDEGASDLKHLQEEFDNLKNELIVKRSQLLRWDEIARSRGFRFLKFLYRRKARAGRSSRPGDLSARPPPPPERAAPPPAPACGAGYPK